MGGFVYQVPPAVGGTVLVIDRIESQNFVTGVSGWAIKANGSAEFFNLISRGSFIGGTVGGKRVEINGSAVPGGLTFYTGDSSEATPGWLDPNVGNLGAPLKMSLSAPFQTGGHQAFMEMTSDGTLVRSSIALNADFISLLGAVDVRDGLTVGGRNAVTTVKTSQRVESGSGSFTTDATGAIAIPCTLGVVPTAALVSCQNSGFYAGPDLSVSTSTSIKVFVRNLLAAGAPVLAAGTVVACRYFYTT